MTTKQTDKELLADALDAISDELTTSAKRNVIHQIRVRLAEPEQEPFGYWNEKYNNFTPAKWLLQPIEETPAFQRGELTAVFAAVVPAVPAVQPVMAGAVCSSIPADDVLRAVHYFLFNEPLNGNINYDELQVKITSVIRRREGPVAWIDPIRLNELLENKIGAQSYTCKLHVDEYYGGEGNNASMPLFAAPVAPVTEQMLVSALHQAIDEATVLYTEEYARHPNDVGRTHYHNIPKLSGTFRKLVADMLAAAPTPPEAAKGGA